MQMGRTQENGTMTDQDMLGPCKPGTAKKIIWNCLEFDRDKFLQYLVQTTILYIYFRDWSRLSTF